MSTQNRSKRRVFVPLRWSFALLCLAGCSYSGSTELFDPLKEEDVYREPPESPDPDACWNGEDITSEENIRHLFEW
jgi:hypothetical protein